MRRQGRHILGVWAAILLTAAVASAQATRPAEPSTRPTATAPASRPAGAMTVTVKEVSGLAQRLVPGQQDQWAPLKPGDELDEMSVIRTGFSSRVVLAFADNSEVVIERATKMGIAEFRKEGQVTRTALGLKYGSMRASVEKARGPNDFTVSTAVATLAVGGSSAEFSVTGDFGLGMRSGSGNWTIRMGFRTRHVRDREGTNNALGRWVDIAKVRSTANIGDVYGGLSPRETQNLIQYGGGRGGIGFVPGGTGAPKVIEPLPPPGPGPAPPPRPPDVDVPGLDIDVGV